VAPALRNRAIILLLLDTGLRASELCGVKFGAINMTANSVKMLGKGHASRERLVYFGKRTSKALWKVLTPRLRNSKPDDLVFTVGSEDDLRPMTRDVLRRLLALKGDIGERAGVTNVNPTGSVTRSPSPTCATTATCSRCRICSATRT
jgi:site-specific recombinase XerD